MKSKNNNVSWLTESLIKIGTISLRTSFWVHCDSEFADRWRGGFLLFPFSISLFLSLSVSLSLLLFPLSSSFFLSLFRFFFSLTLLPAMLCFAEDRICQIPPKGGWGGRKGVSLKWWASGCQRAPRASADSEQLFSGAMTFAAPRALSTPAATAMQQRPDPQKPQRANLNGARALTSQFTRKRLFLWIFFFSCSLFLSPSL